MMADDSHPTEENEQALMAHFESLGRCYSWRVQPARLARGRGSKTALPLAPQTRVRFNVFHHHYQDSRHFWEKKKRRSLCGARRLDLAFGARCAHGRAVFLLFGARHAPDRSGRQAPELLEFRAARAGRGCRGRGRGSRAADERAVKVAVGLDLITTPGSRRTCRITVCTSSDYLSPPPCKKACDRDQGWSASVFGRRCTTDRHVSIT